RNALRSAPSSLRATKVRFLRSTRRILAGARILPRTGICANPFPRETFAGRDSCSGGCEMGISHQRKSKIQNRAMTLVEVLVATVILGAGITGLLSAATLAMRNQDRSEKRAQALYVAQEKLSEVELIGAHVYM